MKTRTLLLLALACGVAIMLAGAVLLFQLTTRDDVEPPAEIGTPVEVGDVTVTVTGSGESDGVLTVGVTLDALAGVDATTGFHLIAAGRPSEPTAVDCPAACTVTFDTTGADARSRVLFYERGDEQVRWVLG